MRAATMIVALSVAGAAVAQDGGRPLPDDLQLLVGKHVSVGRAALCEPGAFTVNLTYAGKTAIVLSVKPNPGARLPPSYLAHMPEASREILLDAENAGTLLLRFDDGKQLDTCGPIGPRQLSQNIGLAPDETIVAVAAPASAGPGGPASAPVTTPETCPVIVTALKSSDGGLLHTFVDDLTTSEFEQQLDETLHAGQGKHYLDFSLRNAGGRAILGVEAIARYTNRMGDEVTSTTLLSQNNQPIKPGGDYRAYAMDRAQWMQSGVGDVTLYINRIRFTDGTLWTDNGSHACSKDAISR